MLKLYKGGNYINSERMQEISREILDFKMPRYENLTHINLYLEQVIDEVVFILEPIFGNNSDKWITPTMVGNYVKQGLLPRPVGKKYTKEHIAYLIYISLAKQVLSICEIKRLMDIQKNSYPISIVYDYFCTEFESILTHVFGTSEDTMDTSAPHVLEANVLRSTVISVCYAIYTRKMLEIY